MSITPERKQELIKEYSRGEADTGSPEVQVSILTERISKTPTGPALAKGGAAAHAVLGHPRDHICDRAACATGARHPRRGRL